MPAEETRTAGEEETTVNDPKKSDGNDKGSRESMKMQDPIDLLTVVKMKEILKKEGLKVSGNKTELQDRLKGHVKSVMEEKREGDNWQ